MHLLVRRLTYLLSRRLAQNRLSITLLERMRQSILLLHMQKGQMALLSMLVLLLGALSVLLGDLADLLFTSANYALLEVLREWKCLVYL